MSWKFHPVSQMAAHADSWDALQSATTHTPFFGSAFIAPLIDNFGQGNEQLAFHHGPDGIDAATILRPLGQGRWETFQPSQLPLGPWLVRPADDLHARMQSLLRAAPGFGLSLGVTQIDPKLQPRPELTAAIRLQEYIETSFIDISGTFETYWEARGKNLRQNTRKQHSKMQTEGVPVRLDTVIKPEGVAEAMAQYGVLESAGWKAGNGTAIHPDNAQGRFYRAMLENFCAKGCGRIVRYWFGDKVVAMDLCIDNGPMVVVLKTAYDESYRQVSPSTMMRQEEFKQWWEEGRYQRIEFYGKTMEWHTRWATEQRALFHVTAYRWPAVGRLRDSVVAWRSRRVPAANADANSSALPSPPATSNAAP